MSRARHPPSVRATAPLVLLGLVGLAAGCGPSTREASVAVLLVAGPVVVLVNALVGLLWLLWRRVRPELAFRWRPFVEAGFVVSAVGLLAAALPFEGDVLEWVLIALWAVGTSYLTIFLLVWRIRLSAPDGLAWAHAIAGAIELVPALLFGFLGATEGALDKPLLVVWMLPGYAGLVAGPLYGLLLIEALVRWQHARRR